MRICDKCIHDKVCLLPKSRASCELFDEYRPHGEWLQQYKNDGKWHDMGYFYNMYKCSNCGSDGSQRWHFCPNCGSDNRPREGEAK